MNYFVSTWMVFMALLAVGSADRSKVTFKKMVDGELMCDQPPECTLGSRHLSKFCCNYTISDLFKDYQFDILFPFRNYPSSQAIGYWDYHSFITAASIYEPFGFGTTGGKMMQMMEVAAFLAHVAAATTCGCATSTGGPLAWGLCYYKEMSPDPTEAHCDPDSPYDEKCVAGVNYHYRGALAIIGNKAYSKIGQALNLDLLSHPEKVEQNATLAFQTAIWIWMTRLDRYRPSVHDAFIGNWKPTRNDTLNKRRVGFGITMNILYGYATCGNGDIVRMNTIVSHYLQFLDLMGVGRENTNETYESLTCGEQVPFPRLQDSAF